jgi:hypothetical protein
MANLDETLKLMTIEAGGPGSGRHPGERYQKGLKEELKQIRVREMSDKATSADLECAKKIVRYFNEIGKPIAKSAGPGWTTAKGKFLGIN